MRENNAYKLTISHFHENIFEKCNFTLHKHFKYGNPPCNLKLHRYLG